MERNSTSSHCTSKEKDEHDSIMEDQTTGAALYTQPSDVITPHELKKKSKQPRKSRVLQDVTKVSSNLSNRLGSISNPGCNNSKLIDTLFSSSINFIIVTSAFS